MKTAIPKERIAGLVETQLRSNFLLEDGESAALRGALEEALKRTETCFRPNANKYYRKDGEVFFSPYHSGQYCTFLYYLANTLRRNAGPSLLCDKLYFLNKMLNALDLLHEVELPEVFFTDHPVGSVLGRAKYGEYFSFSQNCTVGNNKGVYPVIGANVAMMAGARILGKSRIGDNVVIAAGCSIKDQDVPSCSIVFGSSPALVIKTRDASYFKRPSL